MRRDFLDRYARLDSPIHRLPAWLKMAASLALLVVIIGVPDGRLRAGIAAGLIVISVASRIPFLFVLKRLILLEPFVAGIALLGFLQPGGSMIVLSIIIRSTLCLLTVILLSNTTPFAEILRVLKAWHVPALLVTLLALMYRYLFVLIDETERMQRARQSRTFTPDRRKRTHLISTLIGQLFVRSADRAERIYAAMCARGWR